MTKRPSTPGTLKSEATDEFYEDVAREVRALQQNTCQECGKGVLPMHSYLDRINPLKPDGVGNMRVVCRKDADRDQHPELLTKREWEARR